MPFMGKTDDGYSELSTIVNSSGTEIDYVLSKTDDGYKRAFTKLRELTGEVPLSFKGITPAPDLTNYRIYGQTSRNLFDGELVDNYHIGQDGLPIPYTGRCCITTPIAIDTENLFISYTAIVSDTRCIYSVLLNGELIRRETNVATGQTINTSGGDELYVCFYNRFGNALTSTDISSIMLNSGSTPLPYEPYGESVGDKTENLFDKETVTPRYGVSKIDGEIFSNPGISVTNYIFVKPNTTYTNTASYYATGRSGIAFYDINKQFLSGVSCGEVTSKNTPYTYTTPSGCYYMRVTLYTGSTDEAVDLDTYQINEGSTPLPYEPYGYKVPVYEPYQPPVTTYIYLPEPLKMVGDEAEYVDYQEQKQHRVRKNLLPTITATYSRNGLLLTNESDGTVSINGTATTTAYPNLMENISYPFDTILSGCPQGGSLNGYCLRANSSPSSNVSIDFGNGALIPANTNVYIEIRIQVGFECNNLKFTPMIRKADIEDDTYEPYIENTDLDVTLPALPTLAGTNTMSVGTEVQPSSVYLKGAIKALPSGGVT